MAICNGCGAWLESSALVRDEGGGWIVCPECGHREAWPQYPLWWITGSSGAGKSALIPILRRMLPGFVIFDGEAIDFWRFNGPAGDYSSLYNQWLKVAHQIALHGHRVICVATAVPEQIDACSFGQMFSTIRYLGLTCPEEAQRRRLLDRPTWRKADSPEFIAQACNFSRLLEELAQGPDAPLTVIDSAAGSPAESAAQIAVWARGTACECESMREWECGV